MVDTTGTSIEISQEENLAIITWSVINPDSFTRMLIEVCEVDQQQCLESNSTDVSSPSQISIPKGDTYKFTFYMYDGAELVASEEMEADDTGREISICIGLCYVNVSLSR